MLLLKITVAAVHKTQKPNNILPLFFYKKCVKGCHVKQRCSSTKACPLIFIKSIYKVFKTLFAFK